MSQEQTNKLSGQEAMEVMLESYGERRKLIMDELRNMEAHLASLRSNSKDRPRVSDAIVRLLDQKKQTEDTIHTIDSFDVIKEEYDKLSDTIAMLCEKRRELFSDTLLPLEYNATKRDGFCIAR